MNDKHDQSSDEMLTRMSLIELAKLGEPDAWSVVTNLYTPLIRHWAWKKGVRNSHDLENINQEVFKRVFHKLGTFKKEDGKGSFRGWLRTITHNYIYSNHLGSERLKTIGGSDWHVTLNQIARDEPSVGSLLDSGKSSSIETGLVFRRIMNWIKDEYSPVQTSAFKSVVIDQRSARDVAKDLEISVNVVYQTKCRILARIREVFSELV